MVPAPLICRINIGLHQTKEVLNKISSLEDHERVQLSAQCTLVHEELAYFEILTHPRHV